MKKRSLLWCIITVISMSLTAQNAIEVSLGSSFSTAKFSPCNNQNDCWLDDSQIDVSSITGLQGRVGISFPIHDKIAFLPSLSIVKKGFKASYGSTEITFNMNYFEVPLLVKAQFPIHEKLNVYGVVGPSFGLLIGSQAKSQDADETEVEGFPVGNDIESTGYRGMLNTNVSLLLKGGIAIPMRKGYFFAEVGYEMGFSDFVLATGTINEGKLRGGMIAIGYGFNLISE